MLCVNFENDFRKNLNNRSNRFHHHVKQIMNKLQRKMTNHLESMVYGQLKKIQAYYGGIGPLLTYPRHSSLTRARLGWQAGGTVYLMYFSSLSRCLLEQRCGKPVSIGVRALDRVKRLDQDGEGRMGLIVYVLGCGQNLVVWPQMPAIMVSLPVVAGGFGVLV